MKERCRTLLSVTLPAENTGRCISARIFICYSSSKTTHSLRHVSKVCLRVGNLVVQMYKPYRERLHSTLRRMLTVVALYPLFLNEVPSVPSAYTLGDWVKDFSSRHVPLLTQLTLRRLFAAASLSMASLRSLTYGGLVTLTSSPSVRDSLVSLHVGVLSLIEYMKQDENYSRSVEAALSLHEKQHSCSLPSIIRNTESFSFLPIPLERKIL